MATYHAELLKFKKTDGLKKTKTIVTDEYLDTFEEVFENGEFNKKFVGNRKKDGNLTEDEKEYYLDRKLCKIVNGLYISSADGASELDIMKAEKITHIVCLASNIGKLFPAHFEYLCLDVNDVPSADIRQVIDKSLPFIENAIGAGGKVLIHW